MPETTSDSRRQTNAPIRNNSALRLLAVLAKLKGTNGNGATYRIVPPACGITNSSADTTESGWSHFQAMSRISKMLDDLETEVNGSGFSDEERNYHLECIPLTHQALALTRLGLPWDQFRNAIPDTLLTRLQGTEIALRRHVTEEILAEQNFAALRESIEVALKMCQKSSIPNELKSVIFMHLIRVRTAIDEYQYRGLAGVQEAVAGFVGTVATSRETIDQQTTPEEKTSFLEVIKKANDIANFAKSTAWIWPHIKAGATILIGLLAGS